MRSLIPRRFALIRSLRENRYSKTFLANDHLQGRDNVIVKIIRKEFAQVDADQLVEHYSWQIGVQHRQFATVWDAGLTRQRHLYYVRECLPPSELSSIDPLALTKSIVATVDFLSRHGRVHGAIKPSNIFVSKEGLKLADANVFGPRSQNEEVVHFTAPEILRGGQVDREGDLYSLGAFLYYILTGRHLFEDPDLNHLKSKYLSAHPQPVMYLSPVLQPIVRLVPELLSRSRARRPIAFEVLKQAIASTPVTASRAAFIGRDSLLREVFERVRRDSGRLRVVLLEGVSGIGKSRFVSELRLRCNLHGLNFIICRRDQHSIDVNYIFEGIYRLLRTGRDLFQTGRAFDSEKLASDIKECLAATSPTGSKYPQEKTISDLVGILSVLSRQIRLVLAIEDIDLPDARTVLLLEQFAFRASEIPLTLLLTKQTSDLQPKWLETMAVCLGSELVSIRVPRLSREESERVVQYLECDREQQLHVLRRSAGHPLFIENYSKEKTDSGFVPALISETANSMLSKVTRDGRNILQILSIFQEPVPMSVVARLCERADIESDLNVGSRLDLVERSEGGGFQIPYPAVKVKLYAEIVKRTKQRLHARAFATLKQVDCEAEVLAHHAFAAGMAREAGTIYLELARDAYRASSYRVAQLHYERARKCDLEDQILGPLDRFKLARCYQWSGKQKLARRVFEDLISIESVQRDPELLSTAYSGLANVFDRTQAKTRVNFQELAIRCLSHDSPTLSFRYLQLGELLVRTGDLSGAKQAIMQAERCCLDQGRNVAELSVFRATFLMQIGNFKEAVQCLSSYAAPENGTTPVNRNAVLNNLAVCYDNLGDLTTASEYQLRIQKSSATSGTVSGHILSLGNLASIKMKLGKMREAEQLFTEAFEAIENLRKSSDSFNRDRFITVDYDAIAYTLHRGEYPRAAELLRNARVPVGFTFELDRMFCRLVRCRFFVETGLIKRARDLIRNCARLSIFGIDYLQIERFLLEARLSEIPAKSRIEGLERALKFSESLGTLYQRCELFIALASVHLELDAKQRAKEYVKSALDLANENGYRILTARTLLLSGCVSDTASDQQHFLSDAFQLASELGLQELVAEAAYRIGIVNLESGNVMTAREYLIRSTSTTARLADGVPIAGRPRYLAKEWRRDAVRALDRCNESIPMHTSTLINTVSDKYFTAVYRFTMMATAANSIDVLLDAIEKTLSGALSRSAVVILKEANRSTSIPIRTKLPPELTQRIEVIRSQSRSRLFFESVDERGKHSSAWIPMNSEACEGGIYVACRIREPHFTEKEIEFLTMIGTIASGALKRLETREASETEPLELSEFHGIIGASKPIKEVYSQIKMAAGNVATVLIEGESGTGKELVAKAIHNAGPRAKEPFIAVDCGTIPEGLIEAELFGSKKGSYTGAVADRPGLFEAAHRGTIFLDEISNTAAALQAKLLRVIQEREVRRIGETKGRAIDVRLIVASNQSLEALADAGRFRKDLLYRLKVLYIKVPPLRDRRDDIPMLVYAFLQRLNASQKSKKHFASGVVDGLLPHKFPGNVRELQNAVERAYFLAKGIMITEVPLEASTSVSTMTAGEIETWYKDISEGRKDFWSAVHNRYKRRDISREKVVALVDFGLRSTRGFYKNMASVFRLKEREYRRFMDFLRRNDCLLDFRPYRKAATTL